jgi:hypothetical protein
LADEINLVSPAAGAQGAGSRCEIDLLSLYEVSESCQTFHTMFGWAPSYDRGWTGGGRSGGGWGGVDDLLTSSDSDDDEWPCRGRRGCPGCASCRAARSDGLTGSGSDDSIN